jgi:hypothetical protein
VGSNQLGWIDGRLGLPDSAVRFEPVNGQPEGGIDQPVAGWHRRAVVQQRGVENHQRIAAVITNDNLKLTARWTTEQLGDAGPIVGQLERRQRHSKKTSTTPTTATSGIARLATDAPAASSRSTGVASGPSIFLIPDGVEEPLSWPLGGDDTPVAALEPADGAASV